MQGNFVFAAQPPIPPSPGVQTALMDALQSFPPKTIWQSRDLAIVAGVKRSTARNALQVLIRKMLVTYAYEDGEIVGFRLVAPSDWK